MSSNKKILWIDDWPDSMRCMLSNIFHKLWTWKIRSEIAIFGDSMKDEGRYTDLTLKTKFDELQEAAYSEFIAFLLGVSNIDDDTICNYSPLINKEDCKSFIQNPCSDIVLDFQTEYSEIKKEYDSREESEDKIGKNIYKKLKLDQYDCVLIDLRLTSYDNTIYNDLYNLEQEDIQNEKYEEKNKKPLLSMIIYNYIIKKMNQDKRPQVYLFSSYTEPIDFTDNWKKLYKVIYQDNQNIEIFNRSGKEIYNGRRNLLDIIISKEEENYD